VLAIAGSAVIAFGLAACGSNDNNGGGGTTTPAKATVKVGMAYDIGGRGDKSFNDAAAAGLEKARRTSTSTPRSFRRRRTRLRTTSTRG
jgi:basic membrane protein A